MKGARPSRKQTHRFGPGKQSRKTRTASERARLLRPKGGWSGTFGHTFLCQTRFVLDTSQQFAPGR
jgi:hypothetical protein